MWSKVTAGKSSILKQLGNLCESELELMILYH